MLNFMMSRSGTLTVNFSEETSVISTTGDPIPITEPKSTNFLVTTPEKGAFRIVPLNCFCNCFF